MKENTKEGGLNKQLIMCALINKNKTEWYNNISIRFHKIIKNNFINEVYFLKNKLKLNSYSPAIKSVGYKEAFNYLEGKYSYDEFIKKSIISTQKLAKKQMTWIRNWPYKYKIIDTNLTMKEKLTKIIKYYNIKC